MNEITNNHFEYSLVSDETAMSLKSKKNQLDGIYFRYTSEVGQVLYEAQQELADYNNDGLFAKWVEAAGFKRQRAYEYINIYKYAVRITDNDELEIFEKQPKSIQTEMSKPSADSEINQAVFSGDITTYKEYKEREKELKKQLKQQAEQHQRQLAQKDEVINKTYEQLEKMQQQEPKVIEKEVIPEDYEDLKRTTDYLAKRNEHLEKEHQDLLNQRKEVNEKSQKYDELTNAIQQSQGELNRVQQKIADYDGLHKVLKEGNALLAKLSVLVYSDLSDAVANDTLVKNELAILLSRFLKLNEDITKKITNNMIIEGEIIND